MTDLVPADQIEAIIGASRHQSAHLGRRVSTEGVAYILHSHECRDSGIDLRECEYSLALGGYPTWWPPDAVVELGIGDGLPFVQTTLDFGGA